MPTKPLIAISTAGLFAFCSVGAAEPTVLDEAELESVTAGVIFAVAETTANAAGDGLSMAGTNVGTRVRGSKDTGTFFATAGGLALTANGSDTPTLETSVSHSTSTVDGTGAPVLFSTSIHFTRQTLGVRIEAGRTVTVGGPGFHRLIRNLPPMLRR